MAIGGLFGLALAYFTTNLRMDQFVIDLALFFIGLGLSSLLPKIIFGVTLTPPLVDTFKDFPIPFLSQIPVICEILLTRISLYMFLFLYP